MRAVSELPTAWLQAAPAPNSLRSRLPASAASKAEPGATHQRLEVLGVTTGIAAGEGPERRVALVALQRGGEEAAPQVGGQRVPPRRLPDAAGSLTGAGLRHGPARGGGEGEPGCKAVTAPSRGKAPAPPPPSARPAGVALPPRPGAAAARLGSAPPLRPAAGLCPALGTLWQLHGDWGH